ncbi:MULTISPECIES: thiolase family protein [Rhodomicrobium]|uniref:thiolase family protein n=1 Tax=Rhodomicrobium TaxID=1068 RepID=UPI000B4BEFD2|nr:MULTISPECIES: thiolase family protein [Rhodomicrobium]
MSPRRAIVIAARRTAIGKLGGIHRARPLEALAAPVVQAVLADAGLSPGAIDELILGNAVGGGGNPARLIALAAGLPESVPALTIDRQCASGLDAIIQGARLIESGAADAVIAGGAESASTAPWRIAKPANLYSALPQFYSQPSFAPASTGDPGMIEAAENVAREFGIGRQRQDAFALESHRRAARAEASGILAAEIVPLGADARDEGPRPSLTETLLARMPPLTGPEGTVTAGNSCQINDAAALTVIVSDDLHRRLGSPPGLVFDRAASAGVAPRILGFAAMPAFRKLGIAAGGVGAVELNEAFAAQALATIDVLKLSAEIVNTLGGALAYGHPYGASGAILVIRLFTRLCRNAQDATPESAIAMVAAAGGLGVAAIFHAISS